MVYTDKPENFHPQFEIVSCYMEYKGNILLLRRHHKKSEGNRWGAPAGKQEQGEQKEDAIIREIQEETGQVVMRKMLKYLSTVYVKYPEYHFVYHMFRVKLDALPADIVLNKEEHKEFKWISPRDSLRLYLVRDMEWCIRYTYDI